ncbi:MAG: YfhO family protein [bacterium]
MSKKKKKTRSEKKLSRPVASSTSSIKRLVTAYPNLIPLLILFLLLLITFNELLFGGKTFLSSDSINSKSMVTFVKGNLQQGTYPLWNPYNFSGMPSFASLHSAPYVDIFGDVILGVYWLLSKIFPLPEFFRVFANYFLFGLFTYLLMMRTARSRMAALFCALALVFQPQIISFTAFGHNTKIATAVFIPLIFLLLDELLQKRQLHYFALLALSVGFQLLRAHTQIAYYTFMMIGFYLVYWFVESLIKKHSKMEILKSISLVVAALVVGVAMSSWLYLSVLEYAHYSIRGGGTGLDYIYATNWSFSPKEMVTFFIPSFMGFGGETYWGPMPFTDYPLYFGVVTLFFAGLALLLNRDKYVVFFTILALVSLVVSFGKHLPILYGPLFKFLPFFNKFRVPTMIHILLGFAMAVLAGLGLNALTNLKDHFKHKHVRLYIYVFAGIGTLFTLFLAFGESTFLNLIIASGKQMSAAVREAAYKSAVSDALKMMFLIGGSGFLVRYFLKGKISGNMLGGALILLLVVDLWWVDFKIINPKPQVQKENYFAETPAVQFLKSQKSVEPFRIFPVYDNKPENWYMYHKIQNIRGYHAAKLKIYQTFLERTEIDTRNRYGFPPFLAKYLKLIFNDGQPSLQVVPPEQIPAARIRTDNAILDMLNVKYLISFYPIPDARFKQVFQGQPAVFENTGVLPRAFFVDKITVLKHPDEFFDYLKSGDFQPGKEALLEEEPAFDIEPSAENRVVITDYGIHEIKLTAQVAKPALLVLSEIYYPAGWKAYVDGKETKIYKTDYLLRSILLPPGDHKIQFVFEPTSFTLGVWLTFGILFVLLAILVYQWRFQRPKPLTVVAA